MMVYIGVYIIRGWFVSTTYELNFHVIKKPKRDFITVVRDNSNLYTVHRYHHSRAFSPPS